MKPSNTSLKKQVSGSVSAYSLIVVFVIGEMYCAVSRDEKMWPFTAVPMFSTLHARSEVRALVPVALQGGEEIHLVDRGVLDMKVQRVLMRGYKKQRGSEHEAEFRLAIRDLVVSEAKRAGVGCIDAVRVYEYIWNADELRLGSNTARTDVLIFEEVVR